MMPIVGVIQRYLQQPLVRPWALIAPVLVLVLCLPVLRPLRQPDLGQVPERERASFMTMQSIVDGGSLCIDRAAVVAGAKGTFRRYDGSYACVPPMQAMLAAPVYKILKWRGLSLEDDQVMVRYLVVLLCVTVPVALSTTLVYRLGRLFELPRPTRVALALAVTIPSGLLIHATSFSVHAQAAVLLLTATACLSHVAVSHAPARSVPWLGVAGLCAALAACLHPASLVVTVLFPCVILWMRWDTRLRVVGMLTYGLGALLVLGFNAALLNQITGDWHLIPPATITAPGAPPALTAAPRLRAPLFDDEEGDADIVQQMWSPVARWLGRMLDGVLGEQGVLSHYPVVALGIVGATLALRRHWAETTKALAGITLLSAVVLLAGYWIWAGPNERDTYGPAWVAPLLPLVMLWAGAWLRPHHRRQSWVLASTVLGVSLISVAIGMLDVPPARGYRGYSLAEAAIRLTAQAADRALPAAPPAPMP